MAVPVYPRGTTINDRYVLGDKLGSDGSVYEAHDRHLDRSVALKLLHPSMSGIAQPWDEAQRLEALRSEFLVDVINADVVINSDIRFIVTPLLEGGDLEALARPSGLSVREAVRYAQQIAAGIDRIHAAGMVHRDIKPANVLLSGDGVVVSDLEFCEILDANCRAGRTGSWCTVAPEAAHDSGHCSIRTDIYSLGATAFYLMSGEYPVDHRLDRAIQQQRIIDGQLRELRQISPHVSQAVGTVIRKALHVVTDKRHDSAESFGNALAHAAHGARNWKRILHTRHAHCLHGESFQGRGAVDVCCTVTGPAVAVRARLAGSGRRVPGVGDREVRLEALPRHLQQLIKSLR